MRRATAGTWFTMEVFFCGIADRCQGVIILAWETTRLDADEAAVGIDEGDGFDGVVVAADPAMDAAAWADATAAALSSRRYSFRTCLAAFLLLITALVKGDILSGRGRLLSSSYGQTKKRNAVPDCCSAVL